MAQAKRASEPARYPLQAEPAPKRDEQEGWREGGRGGKVCFRAGGRGEILRCPGRPVPGLQGTHALDLQDPCRRVHGLRRSLTPTTLPPPRLRRFSSAMETQDAAGSVSARSSLKGGKNKKKIPEYHTGTDRHNRSENLPEMKSGKGNGQTDGPGRNK